MGRCRAPSQYDPTSVGASVVWREHESPSFLCRLTALRLAKASNHHHRGCARRVLVRATRVIIELAILDPASRDTFGRAHLERFANQRIAMRHDQSDRVTLAPRDGCSAASRVGNIVDGDPPPAARAATDTSNFDILAGAGFDYRSTSVDRPAGIEILHGGAWGAHTNVAARRNHRHDSDRDQAPCKRVNCHWSPISVVLAAFQSIPPQGCPEQA